MKGVFVMSRVSMLLSGVLTGLLAISLSPSIHSQNLYVGNSGANTISVFKQCGRIPVHH